MGAIWTYDMHFRTDKFYRGRGFPGPRLRCSFQSADRRADIRTNSVRVTLRPTVYGLEKKSPTYTPGAKKQVPEIIVGKFEKYAEMNGGLPPSLLVQVSEFSDDYFGYLVFSSRCIRGTFPPQAVYSGDPNSRVRPPAVKKIIGCIRHTTYTPGLQCGRFRRP